MSCWAWNGRTQKQKDLNQWLVDDLEAVPVDDERFALIIRFTRLDGGDFEAGIGVCRPSAELWA